MTITHPIPQPWRDHLRALQQQIIADQQRELMLRGEIQQLQEQRESNRRAAANIVVLLAKEAELPPANYQLSADAAAIVGEVPDPPKE